MPIKRSYASQGDACATAHAMELLGDRWTHPVLRELMLGPKRFSELETSLLGVTPGVLTARLRQLQDAGLVERGTLPGGTRSYAATDWALELRPVFDQLGRWAHHSPLWKPTEGGLTPDAAVQSMLTMAPPTPMSPPLLLELRLSDHRIAPRPEPYRYRLLWQESLSIERGVPDGPSAVVTADSTAWVGALYGGAGFDGIEISGDRTAVTRLVNVFGSL